MLVLKATKVYRATIRAALLSSALMMAGAFAPAFAQVTSPICQSAESDTDGNGWGWENNTSCIVEGSAVEAASQQSNTYCVDPLSDRDGDGWGWENNSSCKVGTDTTGGDTTDGTTASGEPLCQSSSADPDGDGYGWENNATCVVTGSDADTPALPQCSSAAADPDGDGWGWENGASCIADSTTDSEGTNNKEGSNETEDTSGEEESESESAEESEAEGEEESDGENNAENAIKLPADITDLILVTGQSNTLGANTTVDASLDSPHPRVLAFTDEGWQMAELYQVWDQGGHPGVGDRDATSKIHNNFALHFGKRLAELDENAVVGIILVSEPGKGIRNWALGAPGIERVQQKVLAAINSLPHKSALDGILWHQGETDWQLEGTSDLLVEQPAADNYYPLRFASVIENFRLENWFDRNTPFICGETIKAFGVNTHLNSLNSDKDDSTACIEGEGLPSVTEGGNHFNAYALRILGQRYAERYNLMQ